MASHCTPTPSTTATNTPPPPTTKPSPLPRAPPPPTTATTAPFSLPRDPPRPTTVTVKPALHQRVSPPPVLRHSSQPRTPQFLHHPEHQQPPHHQQQQQQIHHIQPGLFPAQTPEPNWNPAVPIRYPLASSGRGLLPTAKSVTHQLPEQLLSSSIVGVGVATQQFQQQQSNHVARGNFLQPSYINNAHVSPVSVPGVAASVRGVHPQSKVVSSPYSAPESNASKDPIDKGIDDAFVTLRDRKVRLSEGASLYALCRSWLRNGVPEANQPQYGDAFKSLLKPLPLPLPPLVSSPSKRKERDDETEADEVEDLAETDAKELLSKHVKRAKKIRARLREGRLQRIERYKSRLVLLLPHSVPE